MSFNKLNTKSGSHAIVIGGSITGLLSACVLAEYFASVTIIEKDKLPEKPAVRKGVPQSAQPHILLAGGYRILERLFPGIGAELAAAGALPIDWVREFYLFDRERGWNTIAKSPSQVVSFTCSRPLLEWCIRKRVIELANVTIVEQHRVVGLLRHHSKNQITGVYLRSAHEKDEHELQASLVVDASGRSSQAPQWLESLDLASPPKTLVDPFLGYTTRRYREPQGFQAGWKVMLISQSPPNDPRLGYLARIENGEWIATLGGYGGDFPPIDENGFLAFARSLSSPKFFEAIREAEPVSPIFTHKVTSNRLYLYDKVELANGFVSLGDAVCALCPVYGQGMTVSALSVIVLRDWLSKQYSSIFQPKDLISLRFQKKLAKSNSWHWKLAISRDLRFPKTQKDGKISQKDSKPNQFKKFLYWYIGKLLMQTNSDVHLHILVMEVAHLLKSPLALYHPFVIFHVFSRMSSAS